MEEPLYHVVLEGRRIGPYNRRTIVGMRQKKALTNAQLLVADDGSQLTVADLIKPRRREGTSQQERASHSLVQATYSGRLAQVQGQGVPIADFKGEVELRVQSDVLRISGRFRSGLGWKNDRAKLPLKDVLYTRARGRFADLWLEGGEDMQRITLDMLTPEAAQALLEWMPEAKPWPMEDDGGPDTKRKVIIASVIAAALLVAVVLWIFVAKKP